MRVFAVLPYFIAHPLSLALLGSSLREGAKAASPQREAKSLPHSGISDYFKRVAISFPSRVNATAVFLWVKL